MGEPPFSPREFLKNRRPEKFSDSVSQEVPALDRSILEYHLETLTSRSQEIDFEHFARALAEHEICPNILPHTGPTGGGDSKVDAETYPVADSLSLAWYEGVGREAAAERWAFAFSAKKKWQPKVEADVEKIVAANRGYKKAFFISNQFIRDKVRAKLEDDLRQKHGIDVRILDRTWILDRIFSNHREALAIDELKIKTEIRVQRRLGHQDFKKQRELEEVEARITEAAEQARKTPAFVDDCLRAIELARGLELPRMEIEGRLSRLTRVAEECGTSHQKFLVEYAWCWTAFWWFEDYQIFLSHYPEAEKRATGATNVYQLELLFNLWCNLRIAVHSGAVSPEEAKLTQRTNTLTAELDRLSGEQEKPSSSLQAETLALMMTLIAGPPKSADEWLAQAATLIDRATGLVGFPFEPLSQILTEIGSVFGDRPAYEALHAKLVEAVATRKGDTAAARLLVQRAAQALDDGRPYTAIQAAGKALARLYKHETREELIEALYICGNAYDRVGLTWAARGAVITAASIAVNEFWTYDEVTAEQAICFGRLRWLELRLGRLPQCLAWHQTTLAVQAVLAEKGYDTRKALEQVIWFDICLAILLLKADLWQLGQLTRLPQTLDDLELHLSAAALRFALGHPYELPEGLGVQEDENITFFKQLRHQPAAQQMPSCPLFYNQRRVTLHSRLLGCDITVDADSRSPCCDLAESLLAALEALLATGVEHRFFAREPELTVNIRVSDFVPHPFRFDFSEKNGRPHVDIAVADFHPHKLTQPAQQELKDKLVELLLHIVARFFVLEMSEQRVKALFGDEEALNRAVNFTSSFVALGNVLCHDPKTSLDDWIDKAQIDHPIQRTEEWDADERISDGNVNGNSNRPTPQALDNETRGFFERPPAHTEMQTVSVIRLPLWDRAKWAGMAYLWDKNEQSPPVMALAFSHGDAGREIFAHWQKEIGPVDTTERLRITIIRGISRQNIHAYRVVVSPNLDSIVSRGQSGHFAMISRFHTMEPLSDNNLRAFLSNYHAVGSFLLMPSLSHGQSAAPELYYDRAITKRDLQLRDAWTIGPNDPDSVALREDDDPVIPPGENDPPILRSLRWLRDIRER